jgi:hypothetical protein
MKQPYRPRQTAGTRHPPALIRRRIFDTGAAGKDKVRAFTGQSCQTACMEIEFAPSPRSSIGLEWELACVDPVTGELAPAAPEILSKLGEGTGGEFPQVTAELLTNTVEVVSGPRR